MFEELDFKEKYKVIKVSAEDTKHKVKVGDIAECRAIANNGDVMLYNKNWEGHSGGHKKEDPHYRWFEADCVVEVKDEDV